MDLELKTRQEEQKRLEAQIFVVATLRGGHGPGAHPKTNDWNMKITFIFQSNIHFGVQNVSFRGCIYLKFQGCITSIRVSILQGSNTKKTKLIMGTNDGT